MKNKISEFCKWLFCPTSLYCVFSILALSLILDRKTSEVEQQIENRDHDACEYDNRFNIVLDSIMDCCLVDMIIESERKRNE